MSTSFQREQLVEKLKAALNSLVEADAAWLGGSRATGSEDVYSDTDMVVVSLHPERIFQAVEDTLQSHYGLERIWPVTGPAMWKGFVQKFYILSGTPDFYYVDFGIFVTDQAQDLAEFFNQDRHGKADILWDKSGILQRASALTTFEKATPLGPLQQAHFEVLYRTFLKESLRGKYIDTYLFYQRLVGMFVQSLRLRHSPQKHDFGLRYLYKDLPLSDSQRIEAILKASADISSMQKCAAEMRKEYLR
nr:hypothetical protein CKG001_28310 [Bdellovibrio sp. CKG001]